MKRVLATTIAIGVAVFGQASMAQPGPPSFDSLDTDESGALSKEEVAALISRRAGRGGGGGAGGGPDPDIVFSRWDTSEDGSVSREEFDNRPRRGGQGGPRGN